MSKLLLASGGSFITDGQFDFFDKPRNQLKWAYITTAGKDVPDTSYLTKHRNRMKALDWDFEEIDIEGRNESQLYDALKDKDAIFMEGGNTFYLIKHIRLSGFENVIRKLLAKGITYVGSSAGSYVACPTMEMATWKEHNKFDQHGVTDYTGMNLVPFLVVAHYTTDLEPKIMPKAKKAKYPVQILTDRQAMMVNGEKTELVEDVTLKFGKEICYDK
jgi:dipeptidase E